MAPPRNAGLIAALLGIALVALATFAAYRAPTPLPAGAPLDEFSAARARLILNELVGDGAPHPIGSVANERVRDGIVARLEALGYAVELQSGMACRDALCGSPTNIVATAPPGIGSGGDAVLLAVHYDSVPAGPGASDDGAAVASALEIARIVSSRPRARHPLVLLLSDGEEAGLLGALLFVREHPLARSIRAAVNLESRGTSGPSLMFETGTANSWLMRLYASAIARPMTNSLYYVIYKLLPNDTDFSVFKSVPYQGFNFAFIGDVGRYHTPLDNVANASSSSIQQQGDNALAALTALLDADPAHAPVGESVFFDVFTTSLVAWSASLTLPAALLALILLSIEVLLLRRARVLAFGAIGRGFLGVLCTLVPATALSAGLLLAMIGIGKVPPFGVPSWIAHPLPMHIVAAILPLLSAAAVAHFCVRRVAASGSWAAGALFCAFITVILAALSPGAGFAFLLASFAAVLAAAPAALAAARGRPVASWATDVAAGVPALVLFAGLAASLDFLYAGLGALAWPVTTFVLSLAAMFLLPLLIAASQRARRIIMGIAALAVSGGVAAALTVPTYSARWPERINVEYWLDADSAQAHYFVRADSGRLPPSLAAAASFDRAPRPRFVESGVSGYFAAAPSATLAAPDLDLVAPASPALDPRRTETGGSHLNLHFRSQRGAPAAMLIFPADAAVKEAWVASATGPVRAQLYRLDGGSTVLGFVGLPAEGVTFEIDWKSSMPATVQLFDQSYSLAKGREIADLRPSIATSSQDGDITVVHRTVSVAPAAGR